MRLKAPRQSTADPGLPRWWPSTGFLVALALVWFLPQIGWRLLTWWPPPSVERRAQRREVMERIQAAGGWEVLRRDCVALAELQRTTNFVWPRYDTNALRAIAKLRPVIFEFEHKGSDSPAEHPDPTPAGPPDVQLVRFHLFLGAHPVGGHATPYFGLEVVTDSQSAGYLPTLHRVVSGSRAKSYRKVADGIYEIF